MPVHITEYHPYAACLMFKACRSSKTVRENLDAVQEHSHSSLLASHERLKQALEQVHSLLRAMPDAPTTSTDVSFDKWRLYADALGICRSALSAAHSVNNG